MEGLWGDNVKRKNTTLDNVYHVEERKGHKREIHKERKDEIGCIQGDMAIDTQRKDKLENNYMAIIRGGWGLGKVREEMILYI